MSRQKSFLLLCKEWRHTQVSNDTSRHEANSEIWGRHVPVELRRHDIGLVLRGQRVSAATIERLYYERRRRTSAAH